MKKHFILLICLAIATSAFAKAGDASVTRILQTHPGGTISVEQLSDLSFRLTANANDGYSFLKWSDGDTNAEKVYTHTADVSKDSTFWAVFTKDADMTYNDGDVSVEIKDNKKMCYTLTVTPHEFVSFRRWDNGSSAPTINYYESDGNRRPYFINSLGSVTVIVDNGRPGGMVTYSNPVGFTYDISATKKTGYTFLQWADDANESANRTYTHPTDMSRDTTLYAIFTRDEDMTYTDGHVAVTVVDKKQPSFQLQAVPNTDVIFRIWDNGCKDATIAYLETDGNRKPFFINNNGSISIFHFDHPGGQVITEHLDGLQYRLIARPNPGYQFLSWMDGATDSIIIHTHTKGGADMAFDAAFTRIDDLSRNYGHTKVYILNKDIPSFTLTAHADQNASFKTWDNGATTPSVTYQEIDGTRVPFFISSLGIVTFKTIQHAGGDVNVTRLSRNSFTALATSQSGYTFQQWIDGDTSNPRNYTHAMSFSADSALSAVFTKNEDMTQTGGTTSVAVKSRTLPSFTLTAHPNTECATFYKWNNGDGDLSQTYQEIDGTLIPIFTHGTKAVKYSQETKPGGEVKITPLTCGFTIEAIADDGYHFIKWMDDATISTSIRDVDYAPGEYAAQFAKSAFAVNGVSYSTFEEAVAAAGSSTPIDLLDDIASDLEINSKVTINGNNRTINNLVILLSGDLTLGNALRVNNLCLNATTGASSQLKNYASNLTITNNAYIDIKLESNASVASPDKWYAFAVPFDVDIESGIARASGSPSSHLSGKDYLVWGYNGTLRASTGNGWEQMVGGTLHPGKFYMIGVDGTCNTWRFTKNQSAALGGSASITLGEYPGDIKDRGWNALGNSQLQYVNAEITGAGEDIDYCQVYNNALSKYDVKRFDMTSFVMACPLFVQVDEAGKSMVLTESDATDPSHLYAPARYQSSTQFVHEVRLSDGNNEDALFLTASSNGKNTYTVGKDVTKIMGGSNTHYIWANAYGMMLCAHDVPLEGEYQEYTISVYVPQAATYTLSLVDGADEDAYLLKDGICISNLKQPETLSLNKGLTNYVIRFGQSREITTDNERIDESVSVYKMMRAGILCIIKNGHSYNAQGQLME